MALVARASLLLAVVALAACGDRDRERSSRSFLNLYQPRGPDRRPGGPTQVGAVQRARLDVRHLTSYVGRRNAEEAYRLTEARPATPQPLFADLHWPDGAIVAFTDHSVRRMSRAELGLGPDDPIVAGESSRSPILRQLSE
jgi:hypothetical protein